MKVLILLAVMLFVFPSPILRVRAEESGKAASPAAEEYAVAARNDVWLYSEENEDSGLFLLPYTYYVRVLERGEEYSAVVYGEDAAPYRTVEGYCKTDLLTFVGFIPERPFLKLEVTVTYTVPGASSQMGNGTFDEIERTFHYYGTSYLGTQRYFYVLSDGVFDYIPAARNPLNSELERHCNRFVSFRIAYSVLHKLLRVVINSLVINNADRLAVHLNRNSVLHLARVFHYSDKKRYSDNRRGIVKCRYQNSVFAEQKL